MVCDGFKGRYTERNKWTTIDNWASKPLNLDCKNASWLKAIVLDHIDPTLDILGP